MKLTNEILPFVTNVTPVLDAATITEEDVQQGNVVSTCSRLNQILEIDRIFKIDSSLTVGKNHLKSFSR